MKYRTNFSGEQNYGNESHLDVDIVLPELEGSEKQIAWANDIRSKYIGWIIQKIPCKMGVEMGIFALKEEKTLTSEAVYTTTDKIIDMFKKINGVKDLDSTSAKYWIENRE